MHQKPLKGRLPALAGADERAAQLTAQNDKLRERLERTEGQVGMNFCCFGALVNALMQHKASLANLSGEDSRPRIR
jgi:hypothetical protein